MHSEEMAWLPVGNWIVHFQLSVPWKIHGGQWQFVSGGLRWESLRSRPTCPRGHRHSLFPLFLCSKQHNLVATCHTMNYNYLWKHCFVSLSLFLVTRAPFVLLITPATLQKIGSNLAMMLIILVENCVFPLCSLFSRLAAYLHILCFNLGLQVYIFFSFSKLVFAELF